MENLKVLIRYLMKVEDKATSAVAKDVLDSVVGAQRAEELMLTYGEELIEQGRQEGLAEGQARGLAEGQARGLIKGQAKGRAEYVLRILAVRGVHVDDKARERILSCTDLTALDTWFTRALNAFSVSDVLVDLAR